MSNQVKKYQISVSFWRFFGRQEISRFQFLVSQFPCSNSWPTMEKSFSLKARPILLLLLFQVLFKFQFQVPSSRLVQGYGDIITYPSISVGDLLRSIRALPWGGDHSGYFVTRRECTDLHVLERRVVGGLIACKITNTKWHYKLSYR